LTSIISLKPEEFDAPVVQDAKSNHVCYIGGIERIRGIAELVAALEHTDSSLILAGKFSNPALEEEMKQQAGWKKVDFRGFQDRKGVNLAMQQSFAGMVTSYPTINYLDALPVKMFEYMAAGLAVIASDFPYWKSIIENSDCGICVNPLDAKAIAEGHGEPASPAWRSPCHGQKR
jgi:glycosyltransferase involved in cell wall biosynthesis